MYLHGDPEQPAFARKDLREIIGGETILSLVKDTFERRKKTDLPQGSVCIRASNLRGLRLLGMGNYGKVLCRYRNVDCQYV